MPIPLIVYRASDPCECERSAIPSTYSAEAAFGVSPRAVGGVSDPSALRSTRQVHFHSINEFDTMSAVGFSTLGITVKLTLATAESVCPIRVIIVLTTVVPGVSIVNGSMYIFYSLDGSSPSVVK